MNSISSARVACAFIFLPLFLAACGHDDSHGTANSPVTSYNLSPLSPAGAAQDWATTQGNAGHTGFVPITVDPAAISKRWLMVAPMDGDNRRYQLEDVATGDGKVFVPMPQTNLLALNEADGSTAWKISVSKSPVSPAAFADGKLFLMSGDSGSYFHRINAATGAILSTAYLATRPGGHPAPTVHSGEVYAACRPDSAFCSFSAHKGTKNYIQPVTSAAQPLGLAVTDAALYYSSSNKLYVANPTDGRQRYVIEDRSDMADEPIENIVPVVGANGLVFATGGDSVLRAFDTATRKVRWRAQGAFAANPAYAGGAVYAINNQTRALEARDAASGKVTWSWALPSGEEFATDAQFSANLVVTNNLVFVSGTRNTYAIDRSKHDVAWQTTAFGKLAISRNGILYIRDYDQLLAINLK
ncbi:PQQ-binding-like beta-propeller repeat protein [Pseudoduganella sp.]|uniref:PQQ-like beta-propeller repeat protein n=1 Tax=Pseudoduganella sp. TaxID=1880898 RepID=UPI0035B1A6D2